MVITYGNIHNLTDTRYTGRCDVCVVIACTDTELTEVVASPCVYIAALGECYNEAVANRNLHNIAQRNNVRCC